MQSLEDTVTMIRSNVAIHRRQPHTCIVIKLHKHRKSSKFFRVPLSDLYIFLVHWRCSTVNETHTRRVVAMFLQVTTELEKDLKKCRSPRVLSWGGFTSPSSWIIPSVVNGFTKSKTTKALKIARPNAIDTSRSKTRDISTHHCLPRTDLCCLSKTQVLQKLDQSERSTWTLRFISVNYYHRS